VYLYPSIAPERAAKGGGGRPERTTAAGRRNPAHGVSAPHVDWTAAAVRVGFKPCPAPFFWPSSWSPP